MLHTWLMLCGTARMSLCATLRMERTVRGYERASVPGLHKTMRRNFFGLFSVQIAAPFPAALAVRLSPAGSRSGLMSERLCSITTSGTAEHGGGRELRYWVPKRLCGQRRLAETTHVKTQRHVRRTTATGRVCDNRLPPTLYFKHCY